MYLTKEKKNNQQRKVNHQLRITIPHPSPNEPSVLHHSSLNKTCPIYCVSCLNYAQFNVADHLHKRGTSQPNLIIHAKQTKNVPMICHVESPVVFSIKISLYIHCATNEKITKMDVQICFTSVLVSLPRSHISCRKNR